MAPIGIALRRVLLILLVAVGFAVAVSWRRGQSTPTPAEPPQWPQWPQQPAPDRSSSAVAPASEQAWLHALEDGSAPESHPIKVNLSSGIFHVPGGRFYARARPDRCYATAAAAEADGYRRSKT